MIIAGAGFAGLIAAHAFHAVPVLEFGPRAQSHKALLRFRSDAVSRVTGIPFRRVKVRKGIWSGGKFRAPDIRLANLYSQKCLGNLAGGDRSLWNLEAADRYIAPEDFYDQLVDQLGDRIRWETRADFTTKEPMISTAPMPVVLAAVGEDYGIEHFPKAAVEVARYRIKDCDLFQTVYFPDHDTSMYRASITGDVLIVEFAGREEPVFGLLEEAFGLEWDSLEQAEVLGSTRQSYGKIAPVDEAARKRAVMQLTTDHGIYSLGRFATWRNILLDDVVDDVAVIKRLVASDNYGRRLWR